MRIARRLLDEMIDHARADAPNECCGIVSSGDGRAVAVHRVRNAAASPLKYVMDSKQQLEVLNAIEDGGLEIGAIYHSHTRTEPYPSQTDVNLAANWPEPLYVIVGVAGEEPEVRAFSIAGGEVSEHALEIDEG